MDDPFYDHFTEVEVEQAARIIEHHFDRAPVRPGKPRASAPYEGFALLGAHRLHRLLAQDETERLRDVRFSGAVGSHHRDYRTVEHELGFFAKRFKSDKLDGLEIHRYLLYQTHSRASEHLRYVLKKRIMVIEIAARQDR